MLVCCVFTPFLEELVYRGFLLTTISSTFQWHRAVLLIFHHIQHGAFLRGEFPAAIRHRHVNCWTGELRPWPWQ